MKLSAVLIALLALGLVGVLCYHAILTRRVRRVFRETPLVYARLELPPDVDLRPVLEQPGLLYRNLALVGTVLRAVTATALAVAFRLTGSTPGPVLAVTVFGILLAPEIVARGGRWGGRAITPTAARVLKQVGRLAAAREQRPKPARGVDPLSDQVLTTIDGREVFDPVSRRILGGLMGLKTTSLRQVLVPLSRVAVVHESWSLSRAVRELHGQTHARIPVSGGKPDEIVGIAHAKDLILLWRSGQEGVFVKTILRDVAYVPSNLRLDLLLREFQRRKLHLVAVQDEYGRTLGLVTLDDILARALRVGEA